jgi:hypothetical protein
MAARVVVATLETTRAGSYTNPHSISLNSGYRSLAKGDQSWLLIPYCLSMVVMPGTSKSDELLAKSDSVYMHAANITISSCNVDRSYKQQDSSHKYSSESYTEPSV